MINTLDRDTLIRQMAQLKERVKKLENMLSGQEMSDAKIKNLSWNKGSGGTLRLGGVNDTDGSLEVYDAFNVVKARLNKNGLAFASNASGGGSSGVYQYFGASPGAVISPTQQTITFLNNTKVLSLMTATAFLRSSTAQPTFSGNIIAKLDIDGGESARVVRSATEATRDFNSLSLISLNQVTAGEHVFDFTGWCDTTNTGEMGIYFVTYAYIDVGAVF